MKQYIVDAFTDRVFKGNPAAVCVMDEWLSDDLMQSIAIENNLSETAFIVNEQGRYHIRWFTPGREVDLCGHATLAGSFVLTNIYDTGAKTLEFTSLSGPLKVTVNGDLFELDFPARMPTPIGFTEEISEAVNGLTGKAYLDRDVMVVLDDEEDVYGFEPDYGKISALPDGMGLFITARSKEYDFVSRTFFPKIRINEDPVCGSAHCSFIPYWAGVLGKKEMTAYQASPRGGIVYCRDAGDRVLIAGRAALYAVSEIYI